MLKRPEVRALLLAWSLTSACVGAWATTAVSAAVDHGGLLDLPWLTIAGAALLAMASSLMKTTFTVLSAARTAGELSVWRRLVSDAILSLVAGGATYAFLFGTIVKNPYVLLSSMLVVGWLGEPVAGRVMRALGDRVTAMVESGKRE